MTNPETHHEQQDQEPRRFSIQWFREKLRERRYNQSPTHKALLEQREKGSVPLRGALEMFRQKMVAVERTNPDLAASYAKEMKAMEQRMFTETVWKKKSSEGMTVNSILATPREQWDSGLDGYMRFVMANKTYSGDGLNDVIQDWLDMPVSGESAESKDVV